MFTKFIEERSFVSETNTSLAFFDECIDRTYDPNNADHVRYLEVEGSTSDRTVFILPPDASDLPSGNTFNHFELFQQGILNFPSLIGKEYKYENFDDLDSNLFLQPEDDESVGIGQPNLAFEAGYQSYINLSKGGGHFATPIAPLARRTKQEIKSGSYGFQTFERKRNLVS